MLYHAPEVFLLVLPVIPDIPHLYIHVHEDDTQSHRIGYFPQLSDRMKYLHSPGDWVFVPRRYIEFLNVETPLRTKVYFERS